MGMIKPTVNDYDPEMDLQECGEFVGQVTRVQQGLRSPQFEGSKPSVAIEFTVYAPDRPEINGKHVTFMAGESIYVSKTSGVPSRLLAFAQDAGYPAAERGIDPSWFQGRWFFLNVVYKSTRYWVQSAIPTPDPRKQSAAAVAATAAATAEAKPTAAKKS